MSALISAGTSLAFLTAGALFSGCHLPTPPPEPIPPPLVVVPATVETEPGQLTVIAAESAYAVTWYAPAFDPKAVNAANNRFTFSVRAQGVYRVAAFIAKDNSVYGPYETRVVIGIQPPDPGPGPGPPTPPTPPADPFAKALGDAYAQETAADKAKLPLLAAFFRQSAETAKDSKYTTVGQLFDDMHTALTALIGADALRKVRNVAGAELDKTIPKMALAPLDAPMRDVVVREFTKVATALGGLK
jgi:hypothetical protein